MVHRCRFGERSASPPAIVTRSLDFGAQSAMSYGVVDAKIGCLMHLTMTMSGKVRSLRCRASMARRRFRGTHGRPHRRPKGRSKLRPGAFLRLEDEVLLTGLVFGATLPTSRVRSVLKCIRYRLAAPGGKEMYVRQGRAWGRFQDAQRSAPSLGWTHALVTDVAAFYEYVDADVLGDTLPYRSWRAARRSRRRQGS